MRCSFSRVTARTWCVRVVVAIASPVWVHVAGAQLPFTSPVDSAAAAKAAAVADTGRMAPAYLDMSRYDVPAMCVAAVQGVTSAVWRRHERDTMEIMSPGDSLPTRAVTIGRACAAKFPIATVDPEQLFSLMKLFIILRDTANMRAVIDRRMALASTVAAKGEVLRSAVQELWQTHPTQITVADALMSRLDALGHEARVPRLEAYATLNQAADIQFDTTALNRYAAKVEGITAELTPTERDDYEQRWMSAENPLDFAWYRGDPNLATLARANMEHTRTAMANFRNGTGRWSDAFIDFIVALAGKVGQPAGSITGKFWFNADGSHTRPRPGRVTLALVDTKGAGTMTGRAAMLRRLARRYSGKGLDIALVVPTTGFSWASPPQSAQDEANTDAWYYLDYMKLPVTLIVDETPFTRDEFGRRVDGQIDFVKHYPLAWCLIGKDGKIRTMSVGYASDLMLERFVQKALAD